MSHLFEQLSTSVYWLSPESATDRPLLGVVTGSAGSLIVDAGNSCEHARLLLKHMDGAGLRPPRYLVLTHWHWDHWFGAAALDAPAFAHAETRRLIAAQAALDWSDAALDARVAQGTEIAFCRDMIVTEHPDRSQLVLRTPDIAFTGALELDLGGVTCRLIHVGGDHAADSIVVHVPEARTVFLSDCRYDAIYAPRRHYTVTNVLPLYDRLLALDAEIYLGGHEAEPISRAALEAEAHLIRGVAAIVERTGGDREAGLAALQAMGAPPDAEAIEILDSLLAGLPRRATE